MQGEDADLEKSGRILNRVIEWGRDGVTIEADHRHVREMLKDLELERGNHSATPCAVERKQEGNARSDESKGENQCEQGQCQTKYDWDDAGCGDDKDRVQMTDDERDDVNDSQALTGGDIAKYGAFVARISYLSHDRLDLKFASMQVCCAMANPSVRDMDRVERIGRYLAGKPRAKCCFRSQESGDLEAYSDADWRGDKATRRSVSAGGDHERWTLFEGMDQEAASGVSVHRRGRAVRRSQNTDHKSWGSRAWQRTWGIACGVEPASGCLSDDVPGQPQMIGQGETRRHAKPVDTGGLQVRKVRHEEGGYDFDPR